MNSKIYIFALVLSVLLISANSYDLNTPNLMEIVKMVLADPEYLALREDEQIKVLEAIYNIVVNNLKKTKYNNVKRLLYTGTSTS